MKRLVTASIGREATLIWFGVLLVGVIVFAMAAEVDSYVRRTASIGPDVPGINGISVGSNRVHLDVVGEAGGMYVVQFSEDLESWKSIATNELTENGVFEISGISSVSSFYRLLQLDEGLNVVSISEPNESPWDLITGIPPAVEIESPVVGSVFSAPAVVLLSATTTAGDGAIEYVEFYEGWNRLGSDSSDPYSLHWSNAAVGTYELSAIAVDGQGRRGTSAPVSISVTTQVLAAEDAHVRGGKNVSLNFGSSNPIEVQSANKPADDRDGYIKFNIGSLSNVSRATFRFSANLSRAGEVETTVYSSGSNWQEKTVTWNTKPPFGPSLDVLNITSTTNAWYEVDVTSQLLSDLSSGHSTITFALHNESNSRATVLVNSREAAVDVPVLVLTTTNNMPRVAITEPVNGTVVEPGANVLISSVAETPSGSVISVEYFDGTISLGMAINEPYLLTWSSAVTGTRALSAMATDSRGFAATSSVVNVMFNDTPIVGITSPTNGSAFVSPVNLFLTADATDSDGTIQQVEFFEGNTSLGIVNSAPYRLIWSDVIGGSYEIIARATDDLGTTATSETIFLTIYDPPEIISSPAEQVVALGGDAAFAVVAAGTAPLAYQWRLNGINLPGQTATNLVMTGIQESDLGLVDVIVTNAFGSAVSASVQLRQGVIVGWGHNSAGQIDVHPWMTNEIVAIDAGFHFNLALRSDGTVKGWGDNFFGQTDAPSDLIDAVAVVAGESHGLALRSDGTVVGWGSDNFGAATPPAGLSDVVALQAGRSRSVALRSDGSVFAWGWDEFGQSSVPSGLSDVVAISAHGDHTLALKQDGSVVAWGWNEYGQTDVPSGLSNVVMIAAGAFNSLVLKSDGTFVGWGINQHGMLDVPAGLTNVVDLGMGSSHSVALLADGSVIRWGGDPSYNSDAPVPGGVSNVVAVQAGHHHSVALVANDGNLLPSVNITSPQNNQILDGPIDLAITADAVDSNGGVDSVAFYANGTRLGVDMTAPYGVVWSNVVMGNYALTAVATDDQGGQRESSAVTVFITSTVNPVADAYVRDGPYSSSNFGTEPLIEIQTRTSGQNRESYFMFDLNSFTNVTGAILRVYGALSGNGNVESTLYTVSNTNWSETSITWDTRPATGAVLDTTTVSERTFGWYDFDVGSFVQSEKSAGRDVVSLALRNVESSRRYIKVRSREAVSNPPMLILSNTNRAPSVSMTAPLDFEVFSVDDDVAVTALATDSDGFVEQVEFFANDLSLGVDTTEPFEFTWTNVGEGTHQLTATATDDIGMSTTASSVTIFVNAVPEVLLTSPTNNAGYIESADVVLSMSAQGIGGVLRKVEFFADANLVAVVTNSPFVGTWSDVAPGSYSIFARVTDEHGATTDSDVAQVTVFPESFDSVLSGRLGYWRFEDSNWLGEEGQLPVSFTNIVNVAHESHAALEVDSGSDAHLRYRDVEENHRPNIDVESGSVVLAFSPNWSSVGNGGGGPGGLGQFFSIGKWTEDSAIGCWNLSINPDGTEIQFVTQAQGFGMTNLVVPVSLSSNVWYQIALTYTSSSALLYLNGEQMGTNGLGVTFYPMALVRAQYGLNVGSDYTGGEQIRGRIDDLETFDYPLTSVEISARPDTDSDRLPDGWELAHGLDPQDDAGDQGASGNPDGDALLNIEEWLLGSDPNSIDVPIGGNGVIQIHTPLDQ